MTKRLFYFLSVFFLYSLFSVLLIPPAFAEVKINEFQIEPDQSVELINTGATSQDVSNWYIDDSGGSTYFQVPRDTILYPNSCLVFTSNFSFNKTTADSVRLFDSTAPPTSTQSALIDSYSYPKSPGSEITYARIPDGAGSFATGSATLGLFNVSKNSCITALTPTITPSPTPTTQPQQTPTPTPVDFEKIYISETMVYPDTGEDEWVEIYNDNDFDMNLNNWYIDDAENAGSTPKKFSLNVKAKSYAIIDLLTSIFNNDGDSVRLLNQDSVEQDSFEYSTGERDKTLGRISFESNEFCIQEPSKGTINNPCLEESPISKNNSGKSEKTSSKSAPNKTSASSSLSSNKQVPRIYFESTPQTQNTLPQGQILGIKSSGSGLKTNKLLKSLSFLSFSYSLLIPLSIFLRIRLGI